MQGKLQLIEYRLLMMPVKAAAERETCHAKEEKFKVEAGSLKRDKKQFQREQQEKDELCFYCRLEDSPVKKRRRAERRQTDGWMKHKQSRNKEFGRERCRGKRGGRCQQTERLKQVNEPTLNRMTE